MGVIGLTVYPTESSVSCIFFGILLCIVRSKEGASAPLESRFLTFPIFFHSSFYNYQGARYPHRYHSVYHRSPGYSERVRGVRGRVHLLSESIGRRRVGIRPHLLTFLSLSDLDLVDYLGQRTQHELLQVLRSYHHPQRSRLRSGHEARSLHEDPSTTSLCSPSLRSH